MERHEKILWIVSGVLAIASVAASTALGGFYGRVLQQNGPVIPYDPKCGGDGPCNAWVEFRQAHPFPWQGLVAKRLAGDEVALIIAEPPPAMPSRQLYTLIVEAFGKDPRNVRKRWYFATDGWVEDLVIVTRVSSSQRQLLDDHLFRDRLAILHQALFGTTFGAHVVILGEPGERDATAPPDTHVTPLELRKWLGDETLIWRRLNAVNDKPRAWSALKTDGAVGSFLSNDGSLVLLTFSRETLRDQATIETLRKPFCEFAVASDAVVGGLQTKTGQITIVGRRRTSSLEGFPPMRFETFVLLAMQNSDLLSQSMHPKGAPVAHTKRKEQRLTVTLPKPLRNTELGALLHMSDQLLKSWSEGGRLQYQYFNYAEPESYPFKGKALSALLKKETRQSLAATWMADGASVIVDGTDATTLTATRTAALPVAYRMQGGAPDAADTIERYGREADEHFKRLGNPIFARVAQYAVLHQLLRTFAPRRVGSVPPIPAEPVHTAATTVSWSRTDGPTMFGGHELGANVVRLRAEGKRLDWQHVNGRTLILYPLADAEAFESNAPAIASAVTGQQHRDISTLRRLTAKPVDIRARAEALALTPQARIPTQPFGYRALSGGDATLQQLAQNNECCILIAPSDRGTTYLAAKGIVLEALETASLVESLNELKKPLLILGATERELRSLAAADTLAMARTLGTAVSDDLPTYAVINPERAQALLQQLAIVETRKAWLVVPKKMETSSFDALQKQEQWDKQRDGDPSTLVLSPIPIRVVAGYGADGGRRHLLDAHGKAVKEVAAAGGTRAQYLMALRRFMAEGAGRPRRVLMMIEHDGKATAVRVGAE